MKKMMLCIVALITLCGSGLCAKNIAGDWQGTLQVGKRLRGVLRITKEDTGGWHAVFYSIDQGTEGIRVSSFGFQDRTLKFTADQVHGNYVGTMGPKDDSISGAWTQNGTTHPLNFQRATKETAWVIDPSSHKVQFITVENNVKLEVLDWGGTGRPLVFLAGLGNTAHVFDKFAAKFTATNHVYGITRRGYGDSSAPMPANGNYSADRLGDDVLAVMDALQLKQPVLVGHSIAGEELSSIGSRYPDKVAGLIYLDAGYAYAYYDSSRGNLMLDATDLRKKLDLFLAGGVQDPKQLVQAMQAILPQFETDLQEDEKQLTDTPAPMPPAIPWAIITEEEKYTSIHVPVLAIFADPHDPGPRLKNDPAAREAAVASDLASTTAQAKAFQAGIPSAHVVTLPNANHFVFNSNEADVLREMNTFLLSLH